MNWSSRVMVRNFENQIPAKQIPLFASFKLTADE